MYLDGDPEEIAAAMKDASSSSTDQKASNDAAGRNGGAARVPDVHVEVSSVS